MKMSNDGGEPEGPAFETNVKTSNGQIAVYARGGPDDDYSDIAEEHHDKVVQAFRVAGDLDSLDDEESDGPGRRMTR